MSSYAADLTVYMEFYIISLLLLLLSRVESYFRKNR